MKKSFDSNSTYCMATEQKKITTNTVFSLKNNINEFKTKSFISTKVTSTIHLAETCFI